MGAARIMHWAMSLFFFFYYQYGHTQLTHMTCVHFFFAWLKISLMREEKKTDIYFVPRVKFYVRQINMGN